MAHSLRQLNISLLVRNTAEFNAFLAEIADQITEEELEEMKFLCGGKNTVIAYHEESSLLSKPNASF